MSGVLLEASALYRMSVSKFSYTLGHVPNLASLSQGRTLQIMSKHSRAVPFNKKKEKNRQQNMFLTVFGKD